MGESDESPFLTFSPVARIRRAWRRMQFLSMSPLVCSSCLTFCILQTSRSICTGVNAAYRTAKFLLPGLTIMIKAIHRRCCCGDLGAASPGQMLPNVRCGRLQPGFGAGAGLFRLKPARWVGQARDPAGVPIGRSP